jgi:glutathione S-transferase
LRDVTESVEQPCFQHPAVEHIVKLYHSPTSPYVRKVRICAITRGLDSRIELVPCNPNTSPAALLADNPLSKVPTLVTDDGVALFDSPVICEYLDSLGDAAPMFPTAGAARWRALKLQAMGDGILDASVPRRGEMQRPQDEGRAGVVARMRAAVERTLDALEADPPQHPKSSGAMNIGSIGVACALGYLDFRFAQQPWRGGRPTLAAWFAAFGEDAAVAATVPKEPT